MNFNNASKYFKEFFDNLVSPVRIYEFDFGNDKKYAISQRGGLGRKIYGIPVKELILEGMNKGTESEFVYRKIPLPQAEKIDFHHFGFILEEVICGTRKSYSILQTEKEYLENTPFFPDKG